MTKFTAKEFSIPKLKGISEKTVEEHLKLYQGYVTNANKILELLENKEASYELLEANRRFGFEFDGMRNHEYYFSLFENGAKEIDTESNLYKKITEDFGSYESWLEKFKTLAKTRGIGWAILYFDPKTNNLLNAWVDEQHLGHLTGLSPIVTLDMWEHSFVADYQPSGKGDYINDFFENINWSVAEGFFDERK